MEQNTTDKEKKSNITEMPLAAKLALGGLALAVIPGAFTAYVVFAGFNKIYKLMRDELDKEDNKKDNPES